MISLIWATFGNGSGAASRIERSRQFPGKVTVASITFLNADLISAGIA